MGKKISLGAAVSIAAVTAAITVSLTYEYAMGSFNAKVADVNERQAMYTKLSEIDQKARQDYVGKINETALTDGICTGYLSGLGDSRAQYLSAVKYKAYLNAENSKSIGVGIGTIQDENGYMEVVDVAQGSPAGKSDVKKGDVIVAIDGEEIPHITYSAAVNKLNGAAGTRVKFKIRRTSGKAGRPSSSGSPAELEITVTMGEYRTRTVSYSMINGNIAYVKIARFGRDTADDFNSAVSALMQKGTAGMVVDLRGNSAGNVAAAASVLDTLLPAGNTVTSRDKNGKITVEYTSKANEVGLPLSVVVNGGTSGAAEIFAADVKDFKKGLVVGEKTAGSGEKEMAVPLSDGSAMILSVAEYLTPGGEIFSGTGIAADINKSLAEDQKSLLDRNSLSPSDDPQVQTAVAALARQGAKVKQIPGSD